MSDHNVRTIQEVFQAFGRGDIPFILDRITDDSAWGYNVANSSVPWHQPVKGKDGVASFFDRFGSNTDVMAFQPLGFIHSGPDVVAHIHITYTVRRTGKQVDQDMLFWWRFNSDGKISGLTHNEDTAQVIGAWG